MLTLYTNDNNPAALKILIAANFGKADVNVQILQVNGKVNSEVGVMNVIQVCDIIIWSTLYPLYKDSNLAAEYLCEFPELTNWLKSFGDKKEFQY
ncbi:hypothetical protein MML48_2g00017991 [Holotrichia oblita]|uniref:Uncharacterized protein n=1 Tax=Holotrichia oblita TaxID=644536 RepID=A0ACB9TM73_HOLOL|nr:hypothetical protein MML48_2g00017991 [Holotrichia oblita]